MTFDLRTALAPVWAGTAYWARREPVTPLPTTDPDGRTRDMRSDEEARRWAGERRDVLAWLPQGASVYDLGCGDGKLKVARPDLKVWGFDPDRDASLVATNRGYELDDRDAAAFDALWCCHVVEHMSDPLTGLAVGIGAVRPGGLVIVETPDFGSPVALEWGERFRLLHDPTHISLFTTESLVRMLRALNVEVLEVVFPGYFGSPLQDRRGELARSEPRTAMSPPAPGNVVAVRGRKR